MIANDCIPTRQQVVHLFKVLTDPARSAAEQRQMKHLVLQQMHWLQVGIRIHTLHPPMLCPAGLPSVLACGAPSVAAMATAATVAKKASHAPSVAN